MLFVQPHFPRKIEENLHRDSSYFAREIRANLAFARALRARPISRRVYNCLKKIGTPYPSPLPTFPPLPPRKWKIYIMPA